MIMTEAEAKTKICQQTLVAERSHFCLGSRCMAWQRHEHCTWMNVKTKDEDGDIVYDGDYHYLPTDLGFCGLLQTASLPEAKRKELDDACKESYRAAHPDE